MYILVYTLSEETEAIIFDDTRKIIRKYENKGISKNLLFKLLRKRGICGSKSTFYACLPKMVPKIIELKKKGRRMVCYPSGYSKIQLEFEEKIKIAERLLSLVEKNPSVGDCFYVGEKRAYLPKHMRNYISDIWRCIPTEEDLQQDAIDPRQTEHLSPRDHLNVKKRKQVKKLEFAHSYSLKARYEILKNLPSLLINFINHPQNEFSDRMKKGFTELINPIIITCYTILQRNYPKSDFYSKAMLDKFMDFTNPTFGYLSIYSCQGSETFDLESQFLKILGRYYFMLSLVFSKRMQQDSSPEQKTVSEFIRTFFFRSQINNDEYTKWLSLEKIKKHRTTPIELDPKKNAETKLLEKISNSLTGKLKIDLNYQYPDPIFVYEFYYELFFTCGLFSILERRILQDLIDRNKKQFHKERRSHIYSVESTATKKHKK